MLFTKNDYSDLTHFYFRIYAIRYSFLELLNISQIANPNKIYKFLTYKVPYSILKILQRGLTCCSLKNLSDLAGNYTT